MSETDFRADIVIDKADADADEYETCRECGSPVVMFVHTNGIGASRTCSDPECRLGLESYCDRQIPGTVVKTCIENTGVETLRDRLVAKLEMLNEYREENGLPPVDIPDGAA